MVLCNNVQPSHFLYSAPYIKSDCWFYLPPSRRSSGIAYAQASKGSHVAVVKHGDALCPVGSEEHGARIGNQLSNESAMRGSDHTGLL